jgi:hypothetical protein
LRPARADKGQALVEMAVTAGVFLLLLSASFTLIPRSLLPAWVDENLALRVRHPERGDQDPLLAYAHGEGVLTPPGGDEGTRVVGGEEPLSFIPLLFPRTLFPGVVRRSAMTVTISSLLRGPRGNLPAGADTTTRRLSLAAGQEVREGQVKPLVEKLFLAGIADKAGILKPLRRLGIDPVRVNPDAIPERKR